MFQRHSETGLQSPNIPTWLTALYVQETEYVWVWDCTQVQTQDIAFDHVDEIVCVCTWQDMLSRIDFDENWKTCVMAQCSVCTVSNTFEMCTHTSIIYPPHLSFSTLFYWSTLHIAQPLFASFTGILFYGCARLFLSLVGKWRLSCH